MRVVNSVTLTPRDGCFLVFERKARQLYKNVISTTVKKRGKTRPTSIFCCEISTFFCRIRKIVDGDPPYYADGTGVGRERESVQNAKELDLHEDIDRREVEDHRVRGQNS